MAELRLESPLQFVKGVGPKKAEVLAQHGLRDIRDLLYYFPRQYLDRSNIVPISKLRINESATIIGEVRAHGILYGKRKRYEVILEDDTGAIPLIWFAGVQHWQKYFKKGQVFAATGVTGFFMGQQMVHPDLERLEDNSAKMIHAGRIIPVYPQTSDLNSVGLNSKGMRRLTTEIFESLQERFVDPVPQSELQPLGLSGLHDAIARIHYPETREQVEESRRRIAFDELLGLQFLVFRSKGKKKVIQKNHSYADPGEKLRAFKELLPFELTHGQKVAVKEIFADLKGVHPMSRLMQGDVGCGKTIVAILASLYVAENNLQTAFMAPTEILAEQHFRTWHKQLESVGVSCGLITSGQNAAKRKATATKCGRGEIGILFGTHALVYDYVSFARLGLVVIDEQHRFGVEQRGKLYAKGDNPDLLVMTATPIPRTLALTLYGDLDVTTITELPPGRKPIRTVWRAEDVRDKVHAYVRDEVKKGGQAYIIYPLIEKSEESQLENVEDSFEELARTVFAGLNVGMVHGRINAKDRDKTLAQFREGQISILMATTVIEVGLDNPNATMIVIEHSERFGLAQLHQLRGRVGRGAKDSMVIAIAHPPLSDIALQRLEYFANNSNGFDIAEADLNLRGPGELFGVRQSGLPELRAADLSRDRDLLEASRVLLERLFADQSKLDEPHRQLYLYLQQNEARRQVELGGG